MAIVCPACKQENLGKDPAFCSFCYQSFKGGSRPLDQLNIKEDGFDLRNMSHPARQSFAPILTKRYDLTGPLQAVVGVVLAAFVAFVIYNYLNGGFYYEEDVYQENGGTVHVHHFHVFPRHPSKGAANSPARPHPSASPASH